MSLDGTNVTIAGQEAVLSYISSGQVNAQVPPNVQPGSQPLTVSTAGGSSATYTMTVSSTEAGLCQGLTVNGQPYLVAVVNDTSCPRIPTLRESLSVPPTLEK